MHPVQYEAAYPERQSRLTAFFRLLLVIPHLIVAALWGIVVLLATVVAWFAILVTGRYPAGLWRFSASFFTYVGRVHGYLYLQADTYPSFGEAAGGHPVQVAVEPPAERSRLTVLFRIILIIPAYIASGILNYVVELLGLLTWLIVVVLGRQPQGLHSFMATCLRFNLRTLAYFLLLVDAYPSFSGEPAGYAAGVPATQL